MTIQNDLQRWRKYARVGNKIYIYDRTTESLDHKASIVECEILKVIETKVPPVIGAWFAETAHLEAPDINNCCCDMYYLSSAMEDEWSETVFLTLKSADNAQRDERKALMSQQKAKIQELDTRIKELQDQRKELLKRADFDLDRPTWNDQ